MPRFNCSLAREDEGLRRFVQIRMIALMENQVLPFDALTSAERFSLAPFQLQRATPVKE